VGQDADDAAVPLQLLQLGLDLLLAVGVLLHVLGKRLLLGLGVVLVEPACAGADIMLGCTYSQAWLQWCSEP